MKRTNQRDLHIKKPRADADPQRESVPPRPEILHIGQQHLIWRVTQRPQPSSLPRPITWDIRYSGNAMILRADLDREGEMRDVDFREVRCRLNEVLMSGQCAEVYLKYHRKRLRQSLHWQRNLASCDPHMDVPRYDEKDG